MPVKNWEDVFLRDISVGLLKELNDKLFWFNRFDDETKRVDVPFYYSLTGGDDFLIDAFIDDVPGQRIETNYDQIPRGIVTLTNWSINSSEQTNPNTRITRTVEDNAELKRIISKIRWLPMTLRYDIKVKVASELDLFKLSQSYWNWLWQYQYFDIEHSYLRMQAFFLLPDDKQTEITRDVNMNSNIYPEQSFSLDLKTYYPIFGKEDDLPTNARVNWKARYWDLDGANVDTNKNKYPQPEQPERNFNNDTKPEC